MRALLCLLAWRGETAPADDPAHHSIEAAIDARGACPACSNALSREHIIAPPAERSVSPFGGSRASSVGGAGGSSRHGSAAPVERTAKVAALVTLLKSSPPGVKSLVFSQVRQAFRIASLPYRGAAVQSAR